MTCIPTLIPDQVKTSSVIWGATQKSITVGYAINDLDATEYNYLTQAIIDTGVVTGNPSPADGNCLATTFEAESLGGSSPNAGMVKITYTGFDYYGSPTQAGGGTVPDNTNLSYSYNEALNQDQTNFSLASPTTALRVYYWPPGSTIGAKGSNVAQQGCTIPVLKPYSTKVVSFFYIVPDGFPDDTIQTLQGYVGSSNSDTWDGGAAKTWLCMGVGTIPVGLPQQVRIDITFMYKPETWLQWAFYQDPQYGGSPIGALKVLADPNQTGAGGTYSNGCAGFFSYGTIDFGSSFGFD